MINAFLKMIFLTLVVSLCGCSTLKSWFGMGSEKNGTETADKGAKPSEANVKSATNQELELKLAQLTAQVDELASTVAAQKARIRVLEKGLMLGVIPEELKNDAEKAYDQDKLKKADGPGQNLGKDVTPVPAAAVQPPKDDKNPSAEAGVELSAAEELDYQKRVASAQDDFRAGNYGKAIVEYSDIAKTYPGRVKDGAHEYWIALSWTKLKEYQTAQERFQGFIKSYPGSPWIPNAYFYSAQIEYRLGMHERAVKDLKEIIAKYPNEDAAEMAKSEINSLEKNL